jgi:hypothetical protein
MTHLPSSRVLLQLETTTNTKPACSAAEIRGRTSFWLLIGRSGALCKSSFWEISIDRILSSINRLFRISEFPAILTKTLENNKAKGLTSANQGVQIHHIWYSSIYIKEGKIPSFPSYFHLPIDY